MSSGKRIGDLVEVPPIRTVIRLEEGKEKKEGSETSKPLDNVGYRLALEGMNKP